MGTLEKHVAKCGFIEVPCPKQCKYDNNEVKCFMQKDLEEHLKTCCPNRDHECEHCGKKSPYAFITQVHDGKCRKKIIPCPNAGCGDTMERQQVRKHVRTKCLYAVIPCKYKGLGCDTELKREDMAAHEQDDKFHLHMALETVNLQHGAIGKLQQTTNSQRDIIALQQVAIDSLQATVKSTEDKVDSLHIMLKNKASEIETFRLIACKKKKWTKVFYFPPFYTHPNGYRMALRVDANGVGAGEGTHVSVYAPILVGEYDAELEWPFVGSVTFILLNQLEDKNHHAEVVHFDATKNARVNGAWCYPDFIPHSALAHDPVKNIQYLKDDTLYFKMAVEVTNRKPWLE